MSFGIKDIAGLELFSDSFEEFKDDYVIIGGIATAYAIQIAGLQPRITQDIDLVIYSSPNNNFANQLSRFVILAGYQNTQQGADKKNHNFRFSKPANNTYPKQIEIFSANPFLIKLREDQRIVPLPTGDGYKSLSAILMEDDYVQLAKERKIFLGNIPLLDATALICSKIAAFMDLSKRKEDGESVDSKEIRKHRNDVFVLLVVLEDFKIELPEKIKATIESFLNSGEIQSFDNTQLNQILRNFGITGQSIEGLREKLGNLI